MSPRAPLCPARPGKARRPPGGSVVAGPWLGRGWAVAGPLLWAGAYCGGVLVWTHGGSDHGLPPFDLSSVFTQWELAPVLTLLLLAAAGAYLTGVQRLRQRGDRWPWGRTFSFVVVGLGAFFLATSSGLAAYDTTLLSVHMVQHMVLSMLVPLALALGAPVTLALRTLPARPRRWLLACLHSRVARVLSFPPLAFLLYVVSPWALYFTGWYDASLTSTYVHEM